MSGCQRVALSQLRGRRTSFPEEGNSCRELCGLQSAMDAAQMQMVTILYYEVERVARDECIGLAMWCTGIGRRILKRRK